MAKILVGTKQYYEVNLGCFHEPEIQEVITSKSSYIYPGFYYANFDVAVNSEYGTNKPDFLLVESDYRSWWVGEIELIDHSLNGHVLPQIRTFRDGTYNQIHVSYAVNKNDQIDSIRFGVLIETIRPNILVVLDRYNEEWESAIKFEGAKLGIFEMFRRKDIADFIFRINGFIPQSFGDMLTFVEVDPWIHRLLRVEIPSALPGHNGDVIPISINSVVSDWKIQMYEDKAWLNPIGGHILEVGTKYSLKKTSDDSLILEKER